MHHGIFDESLLIDHIDNNPLNNRIENLRLCNLSENARNANKRVDNSSGYKGVSWHKQSSKWVAQITVNGKRKHLGFFKDKEEAHEAYCEASKAIYGDFANSGGTDERF